MPDLKTLTEEAFAADHAWTDAYKAICPKGVWPGDFRYTPAAIGAEGSELRRLYEAKCAADEARHAAFRASLDTSNV